MTAIRRPGRRPGPSETREQILTVARELFAERGYDGTSVRAIGRAAGVDPSMVYHFFGNKEGVFVAAMRFPVRPDEMVPMVAAAPPGEVGELLVRIFFEVWGNPEHRAPVLALLRSAMTNEQAAAMLREFLTTALVARAAELRQVPRLRVNAASGQLLGVAFLRYVLRLEPIASASTDELVELLAPTLQRYLEP